LAEKYLLA
jgi:hypothetical protein